MIDNPELIRKGYQFLTLIYEHSNKNLSKAIAEVLIKLSGGGSWFNKHFAILKNNHLKI
jgi:hypothetical protein